MKVCSNCGTPIRYLPGNFCSDSCYEQFEQEKQAEIDRLNQAERISDHECVYDLRGEQCQFCDVQQAEQAWDEYMKEMSKYYSSALEHHKQQESRGLPF